MKELQNVDQIISAIKNVKHPEEIIKTTILTRLRQLRIIFDYNKIVVKEQIPNGIQFKVKNIKEVEPEDKILIAYMPLETEKMEIQLTFISESDYGVNSVETDTTYINEYFEFLVNQLNNGKVYRTEVVAENPMITVFNDTDYLENDKVEELFHNYIDNYVDVMGDRLNKMVNGDVKFNISQIYGKEFEKTLLGRYQIPIWTVSMFDPFISIKTNILNNISDTVFKNKGSQVEIEYGKGITSKYNEYYTSKAYKIPYRIIFAPDRRELKDVVTWECVNIGTLIIAGVKSLRQMIEIGME